MAVELNIFDKFLVLTSKITEISYGRSTNNRILIKETLEELNKINYKYSILTNPTKAVLLINQCCNIITPEDTELTSICCQLIKTLLTQQNLLVEGRTLSIAILWCLKALESTDNGNIDILAALHSLLKQDVKHNFIYQVITNKNLIKLTENNNPNITVLALKCIETVLLPSQTPQDDYSKQYQTGYEIFIKHLCDCKKVPTSSAEIKIYTVCLQGLQNICLQYPEIINKNLGITLGCIRSFMLFGIDSIEFLPVEKISPSTMSMPETVVHFGEKKGGKLIKQRKQRTPIVEAKRRDSFDEDDVDIGSNIGDISTLTLKTSDSDFSDTESVENIFKVTSKVREAALNLFKHINKVIEKNVRFSYWTSFVPEDSSTNRHTLVTCILKDPTPKVRLAALNVLLLLLTSSKLYLRQAEKGDSLAFTPFAVIIGLTLTELHKCLTKALDDYSYPVIIQVLKCYAGLIQATPYHKLSPGLITSAISSIKPFIYHKDFSVQVTALIALGCCIASDPQIPETKELLQENNWLIERCLKNLGIEKKKIYMSNAPTALKMESFQILSVISSNYFDTFLIPCLEPIRLVIQISLNDKYSDVRFHAGRTLNFIGQSINQYLTTNSMNEDFIKFWEILLEQPLIDLIQSDQSNLRTVGCDCLSSIGPHVFEYLSRHQQVLCVTLLFNCSRDDDVSVKGAAVRGLGICLQYPSLKDDYGFILDSAEIIYNILNDKNFTVKLKASWALGNLSETLVLNRLDKYVGNDELPDTWILKLLKLSNQNGNAHDKIRVNLVRTLGNLLLLINAELFHKEKDVKTEVKHAFDLLLKNCSQGACMKIRWNSCYALANAMKNPIFFNSNFDDWQEETFKTLTDLAVNFRNFKVRINATVALSTPKERSHYGQYYYLVWSSLCKALETAQNMEDFNEYKHRDQLIEQICLNIGHLITLLTVEDLTLIHDCVILYFDNLEKQLQKLWDQLLPEKSTILFEANTYLSNLASKNSLKEDEKETIQHLQQILRRDL